MIGPDKCPTCGGTMIGDGHTSVRHCERVDAPMDIEADAGPLYCCSRYNPDEVERECTGNAFTSSEAACEACITGYLGGCDSCRTPPEATLPEE